MSGAAWVVLGAAVGAPLRYLAGRALNRRWPTGTLLVNVAGSFLLGLVLSPDLDTPQWMVSGLGTGFCGALTTYSAFALETVDLAEHGRLRAALANVVANVVLGLLAAAGGFAAGYLFA
jgi:CrcB protein